LAHKIPNEKRLLNKVVYKNCLFDGFSEINIILGSEKNSKSKAGATVINLMFNLNHLNTFLKINYAVK